MSESSKTPNEILLYDFMMGRYPLIFMNLEKWGWTGKQIYTLKNKVAGIDYYLSKEPEGTMHMSFKVSEETDDVDFSLSKYKSPSDAGTSEEEIIYQKTNPGEDEIISEIRHYIRSEYRQ